MGKLLVSHHRLILQLLPKHRPATQLYDRGLAEHVCVCHLSGCAQAYYVL